MKTIMSLCSKEIKIYGKDKKEIASLPSFGKIVKLDYEEEDIVKYNQENYDKNLFVIIPDNLNWTKIVKSVSMDNVMEM